VTAFDGTNDTPAVQEIVWNVTDVAGKNHSSDSITIRKDDSLLLTATGSDTVLEIDADGDGVFEHVGAPGDAFVSNYAAAGASIITAKIDGEIVGTLEVTVVSVDMHGPVACQVGFLREHDVFVTPASARESIVYVSVDSELLYVNRKELTADGALLELRPDYRGTPVFEARLGSATGSIVATQEIDEFTFANTAAYIFIVHPEGDEGARSGSATLTMTPLVPGLAIEITINSTGVTFDGGATILSISTDQFEVQPDGSGTFDYQMHLAPGYDAICIDTRVLQEHSPEEEVGHRFRDNGTVKDCTCKVSITGPNVVYVGQVTYTLDGLFAGLKYESEFTQCSACKEAGHPSYTFMPLPPATEMLTGFGCVLSCFRYLYGCTFTESAATLSAATFIPFQMVAAWSFLLCWEITH